LQGSPTAAGQLRQLLADRVEQPGRRHDEDAVGRHEAVEPADGVLEQRARAREREQLLRHGGPARGPEAGAGAAGHHDRVEHGKVSARAGSIEPVAKDQGRPRTHDQNSRQRSGKPTKITP
jgi:hypothetical protein